MCLNKSLLNGWMKEEVARGSCWFRQKSCLNQLVRGCLKLRKPWSSLMVSECVFRNHPGVQTTEEPARLLGEVGKVKRQVSSRSPSPHQGGSFFFFFKSIIAPSPTLIFESLYCCCNQNKTKQKSTKQQIHLATKTPTSQWSPCNNIVIQKKNQTGPEKERWEQSQNLNPVLLTLCPKQIPAHWESDVWSFVGEHHCRTDVWETAVGANPDLHRDAL